MDDNTRKGLAVMLGLISVMTFLLGFGMVMGGLLGDGLGSTAGKVGSVLVLFGALVAFTSAGVAPKKREREQ